MIIGRNDSGTGEKRKTALRSDAAASVWLVIITALLLIARAFVFGITYYPQLDDYLQFSYNQQYSSFADLQAASGLLASRPLAGLADYFIWSNMPFAVDTVILCFIFAVSVVLIRNALRRYFDLSALFVVIMALVPLGTEATYWLSASTRVIMGTFAAALSEWLFVKWLDVRGRRGTICLVFSGVLMTASFWFYEQTGLLACALLFVTACLERRKSGLRPLGFLVCIPAAAAAFYFPTLFIVEGSGYSSRIEEALASTTPLSERIYDLAAQVKAVMISGGTAIMTKGFRRGAAEILSGGHTIWLILVVLLCVLIFAVSFAEKPPAQRLRRKKTLAEGGFEKQHAPELKSSDSTGSGIASEDASGEKMMRRSSGPFAALFASAVLFLVPILVFLLQGVPWFCFRNAVVPFAGIALLADYIVTWISSAGGEMLRRILPAVFAAFLALFFVICGVSEIMDYKAVYSYDSKITRTVRSEILTELRDEGEYNWKDPIGVIGISYIDQNEQNYFWHDHVLSCTTATWSLDAATRTNAVPILEVELLDNPARLNNDAREFDYLYYYDRDEDDVTRVKLLLRSGSSSSGAQIYDVDDYYTGEKIGTMEISGGIQTFTKLTK
ncbi:MAG: hypothetical protein ACOYJI_04560 [Anaerovoracaceae bacterium]|jgi:hypothetical protein